jgi:4-amino-4-deoxy-L-arabinose transferase-like glycosyltransferase
MWRTDVSEPIIAWRSARDRWLIAAALACALLAALQVLDYGYGRDQGIYETVARTLRDGGVPYREAWDFKPPGIYFVYALADRLFGPHTSSIRWIEAGGLASLVVAFALLSRRFLGDIMPGLLGASFAIVTYAQMEFWHTAQPESFGAVMIAWALVCSTAAIDAESTSRRRAQLLWAAAGICSGVATLLKPTIGIGGAASIVFAIVTGPTLRSRAGIVRAMTVVIVPALVGAALPLVLCTWFFASRGALRDLVEAVFVFAPKYTAIGWQRRPLLQLVSLVLKNSLFSYSAINAVGLLLLLLPLPESRLRQGAAHVATVVLALILGVFVQARLFLYHFGSALPLTALLAGWGFWRLWERLRERNSSVFVFVAFLVTLAVWMPANPGLHDGFLARSMMRVREWTEPDNRQQLRDYLYSIKEYDAMDNRLAADWIRSGTSPNAAILVYGFTPELYASSGRAVASRYIYNVAQRTPWSSDRARSELMVDLARSNPEVILVEHRDFVDGVVGLMVDSVFDMHEFAALRGFIATHYTRAATLGRFDVYRRRQ